MNSHTREQLRRMQPDPFCCPEGDVLYPYHDWPESDGAQTCRACGLTASLNEGLATLIEDHLGGPNE